MELRRKAALLLFLLLLSTPLPSAAQNYSQPYDAPYSARLNSTVAVIIVVLVCVFFSMVFFSLYLRRCTDAGTGAGTSRLLPSGLASRSRRSRRRGLDKAVVDSFPMMVYSEVKELKLGKGTLECAVCLSEFDDAETLRLLPRCNHAFHPECIGMWLDSHATCPVCRADLAAPPPAHVVVPVDEGAAGQEEAAVADEGERAWTEEERERFTLRLPEGVREEVMAKRLDRSATLAVAGRALSKGSKGGWSFKREWAAKSDRWAVMGRSWSFRTLRGSRQAEGSGTGRDEGETSAAADQRV